MREPFCDQLRALPLVASVQDAHVRGIGSQGPVVAREYERGEVDFMHAGENVGETTLHELIIELK